MQDLRQKILRAIRLRIREEVFLLVVFHDQALVHKDHAVRDLLGKAHFVCDAHHRHAFLRESDHHVEHFVDHFRIECRGRFVEQHRDRGHRQRTRNRHALLLTARQLPRKLIRMRAQTNTIERSGRPARITQETRLQLIALACEAQEAEGRVTPTLDEIVVRAVERGIVGQISRSHVQRILQAGDIRPHRVQQWLHSPDPAFREKVNVICKLYRRAPRNAVVLSIDEKTGIQAIERKYPGRAPGPGRLRRREFEYIRHGTQALIAALDVHTGQVLGSCRERRTQDDLVAFMESVARAYPGKQVHVIWDQEPSSPCACSRMKTAPLASICRSARPSCKEDPASASNLSGSG